MTKRSKEIVSAPIECYHPSLHLLALERKGWRRWVFGRWVYNAEPFRRDIQRRCVGVELPMARHETLGPEWEEGRNTLRGGVE